MKKRLLSLILAAMMIVGSLIMTIPVSAKLNFNDTDGHWGESAIEYVVENGLMNGVGDGKSFAPNMSLTRGMVVTVLYRDNGSPKQPFAGTFIDVKEGMYYTAAAEWAFANGIVNGTGTDEWGEPYFSPDRDITRQELATMFKRYADFKHVNTSVGGADISVFPDATSVASWASDAVKWAVGVGLITGKGGNGTVTLSPVDKAVRAEFATIIKRFQEADFEYNLVYNAPVPKSTFTEIPYAKVENADIYVAVDGNDSNPGTKDKPLATLEAAKTKVRELKKTVKDEIVVAFMAGDYGILDNVTFTAEDSGSEKIPVTYCAYGDGEVYFTNGVYITEGDFSPLNESDKIFFNADNYEKIMKVEFASHPEANRITSSVKLSNADGLLWQARMPNKMNGNDVYLPGCTKNVVLEDSPYTMDELIQIYIDNTMSSSEIASFIDHYTIDTKGVLRNKLASYRSLEGVQLIGYICKVWHQDTHDLKDFDKETGRLTFYNAPTYPFYAEIAKATNAYINNVSEELDDYGEYWFNTETKTLYVYNPTGNYYMATSGTFITIHNNVNYITLRKLNFRSCTDNGICANGSNFTFDQGSITFVGGSFAFISRGALNVKFMNSEVAYCSESGICIEAPSIGYNPAYFALENTGCVIRNNSVHDVDIASVPVESGAIRFCWQVGADVSHNEIYNSARYAIDFKYGNIDCIMEYNHIHHCMQNSADGGALYCGRVAINRGNTVRYNIIADIYALNPIHSGGSFAIYLDDGMENLICYGNIFYEAGEIMNNNGSRHVIHDNVFIGSSGIVGKPGKYDISEYRFDKWDEGWNEITHIPDENTENGKLWKERWPELYDILAICKDPSIDVTKLALYTTPLNYCHNNYTVDGAEHNFYDEWLEFSDHENNVAIPDGENPLFINPTFGDYTIKEGANIMDNHFALIGRY